MFKTWLLFLIMIAFGKTLSAQTDSFIKDKTSPDSLILVEGVSLIQLIATPERYHGKMIEVIGYLNLEFEGNGIYLHKEDFDNGLGKNGLWVSFSESIRKRSKLENYSKQYVIVIGIFDMNSKGHFGLYSGEIKNITRLDPWNHKR